MHINDDPRDTLLVQATHLFAPQEVSDYCGHLRHFRWQLDSSYWKGTWNLGRSEARFGEVFIDIRILLLLLQ